MKQLMLQHAFKSLTTLSFLLPAEFSLAESRGKNRRSATGSRIDNAWRGESCLHITAAGFRFSSSPLSIFVARDQDPVKIDSRLNALKISEIPIQVGASISRSMVDRFILDCAA